ncbi:flagellar hook assembly protein [Alsobacter metallidurans]|uniref:Basal-body rod modification protein FlgD n=1 Tax=Alsobacter metallidurans TaxID=340221 RepID=A0A917IC02_9HYPH|nr:flagellar hook capping FlgD N-terminal domain-containing protein [Alsobacter metallidurans]GGH28963.1 flagellar hook assembly protein [Alsobacter metallidurans]
MSTVGSTTSSTTGASKAAGSTDRSTLASNFDQFLLLLTTQLKNQNPLDPLDTNQFTQQLVQFASVEQQIKTNTQLTSLLSATQASTATSAATFLGATITADGATTALTNGKATWSLDAARSAQSTVTIKNSSGQVVYTGSRSLSAGAQDFTWDGKDMSGQQQPAGDYTISVAAQDSSNTGVNVKTQVAGVVDGVDFTGATPVLKIGNISVAVDKVLTLRRTAV